MNRHATRFRRIGRRLVVALIVIGCATVAAHGQGDNATAAATTTQPAAHPFGFWSIMPAIVAIVLAMLTRRVLVSLLAGTFVGAVAMTFKTMPDGALDAVARVGVAGFDTIETHVWGAIVDGGHLRVFGFTLMMGAMVGVISKAGGMHGLVNLLLPLARGRRGGQIVSWFLGLFIFFDDYANTVVLGNTLRPMTDRLRISRAKLAYLVDSTAAPVAGLAIVSTWIAIEVEYIGNGLAAAGLPTKDGEAFGLFLASIPYRFYVLWALAMVLLVGWMKRDFGPMLRAEQHAAKGDLHGGDPGDALSRRLRLRAPEQNAGDAANDSPAPGEGATDSTDDSVTSREAASGEARQREAASAEHHETDPAMLPDAHVPRRWWVAVAPIAVVVATFFTIMLIEGLKAHRLAAAEGEDAPWYTVLGAGDAFLALFYAALAGVIVAVLLARLAKLATAGQTTRALFAGAATMLPGLFVLTLAWALAGVVGEGHLDAGGYLAQVLHSDDGAGGALPVIMPALVFVLAAIISFATGTSWGTMAMLLPLAVPAAAGVIAPAPGVSPEIAEATAAATLGHPVLIASIGSVLAGAIFGDHCSPISDTTVLSSQASGCDHLHHVETQMPYALLVGGLSVVGLLLVGLGTPAWLLAPLGVGAIVVVLRLVGKEVEG